MRQALQHEQQKVVFLLSHQVVLTAPGNLKFLSHQFLETSPSVLYYIQSNQHMQLGKENVHHALKLFQCINYKPDIYSSASLSTLQDMSM